MFLALDRIRAILSTSSTGVPDAPSTDQTFGRLNATWFDTFGIRRFGVPGDPPVSAFDFNDSEWQTRTGTYSAVDVLAPSISNAPFEVLVGELYSFVIECLAGIDGAKQRVTVRSNQWEGERFYIRTADVLTDITTVEWKELETFYSQIERGSTNSTAFTTILTHLLDTDTAELIKFFITGVQTSGGSGRASFGLHATAENIAGTTVLIGATLVFQHKTVGVLSAQIVDEGSANILAQVRGTNADWDWRVEANFNEIRA